MERSHDFEQTPKKKNKQTNATKNFPHSTQEAYEVWLWQMLFSMHL